MPLYELTLNDLQPLPVTSFAAEGIRERADLQRLLRDRIAVISPETLVLAEEFCDWQDSSRRIDLLGLDRDARLVVIELKRTDDGGHMELQALRYAAMVSTMTFEKAVDVYARHLARQRQPGDARAGILAFLGWEEPDENAFAQDVRIVLVSADFHPEISTTVLWLNQRGLDLRCVRLRPYKLDGRILIDVQPIIPLPEAEQYQVRIRHKEDAARITRETDRAKWDEPTYMAALEKSRGAEIRQVAKAILDWFSARTSEIWWGEGRTMGSFVPVCVAGNVRYQLFAAWTSGVVEIYFQWLAYKPPFADEVDRLDLRNRLVAIPGVEIPREAISRRPSFDIKHLVEPANLQQFFSVFDWALQRIRDFEPQGEQSNGLAVGQFRIQLLPPD
jgi:hypothetical protein